MDDPGDPRPLSELAATVGGEVFGDPGRLIRGVNGLSEAGPSEISFYGNSRYRHWLEKTKAGAILVDAETPTRGRNGASWVDFPIVVR